MKQTAALYHLQTLDSQIDTIRKRLAEIEALLRQNRAVRLAEARLARATTSLREWRTRLTDLELQRLQIREEADSAEQRLYSGKVHNPRELTELQEKVGELRRRHRAMEEPVIEAMLEIEAGEEAVEAAEAQLDQVIEEKSDAASALMDERERLLAELAEKEKQVEPAREAVEPQHLRIYDRLRARPGGLAVTALTAGSECTACGMQVTSRMNQQVRRGEVMECPTCGRILFHP